MLRAADGTNAVGFKPHIQSGEAIILLSLGLGHNGDSRRNSGKDILQMAQCKARGQWTPTNELARNGLVRWSQAHPAHGDYGSSLPYFEEEIGSLIS